MKDTDGDAIKGGTRAAGAILLILLMVGMFVALKIRRNRKLDKITGDALELVENPGPLYATIDKKPSEGALYATIDKKLSEGALYATIDKKLSEGALYATIDKKPSEGALYATIDKKPSEGALYATIDKKPSEGALYATIDKKPSPRSDETRDQGDVYNKLDRNAGKSKSTPTDQCNEKVEDEGMYARLDKASKAINPSNQYSTINKELDRKPLFPESNTEDLYKLDRRNEVETRQSTPAVKLGRESANCDEESSYADHVVTIATKKEDTYIATKKEDTYAKLNRETLSNLTNTGTEAQYENHNTASEDQEFYSRLNRFNKQNKLKFPVLSTEAEEEEEEEEDAYADVTITQQPDGKDDVDSNLGKCPDSSLDDTDTYTDLEFVGKRNEAGLMFSNPGATGRDDSIYITVTKNS